LQCSGSRLALMLFAAFLLLALNSQGAIPTPEKLVPDDTLILLTAPDFGKLKDLLKKSPPAQLWDDPAMKPFRDSFMTKWKEEFLSPLQRELNVNLNSYLGLLQGQLTLAVTRNAWQGEAGQALGLLLLLDTKDKSGELQTNLTELRKRWVDAGKIVRSEKIRDLEFSVVTLSSNDLPKTLRKLIPAPLEYHELGEPEKKAPPKTELVFGQVDSLLIVGNSLKVVEKIVSRLTGGTVPTLGESAAYEGTHQAMFREAPVYGWLNAKAFIEILARKAAEKKDNPNAPNPMDFVNIDKLFSASGLLGLKTIALSLRDSNEGMLLQVFLGVPEASRSGLFQILAGEPKETAPPPFVPADALKFQRWRIDGQKAWAALQKMLAEVFPESIGGVNFILDTANQFAKDKDPGFDIKKNLFGNLGDDIISYDKPPRGGPGAGLDAAPSLLLLGSPNPQQLAVALKSIFVFMTAQSGAPEEREFLGRKIFSVPLPSLPFVSSPVKPSPARKLSYAASGGYVAFSTDPATLEEYLRSSESNGKTLRETPGLTEAAQKVTGSGTDLFGFENQVETTRAMFELLKRDSGALTNNPAGPLQLLPGGSALSSAANVFKGLLDFSLLPAFDKLAKYFTYTVYGGGATVEGLSYKFFAPIPPSLRAAAAAPK
jgi:hypothetical protein